MKTFFAIISMCFALFAQAQTSSDTPKPKEALERFPQADRLVLFSSAFGGHDKDGAAGPRNSDGKGILKNYIKPNQPPMINFFGTEDPLYPGEQQKNKPQR